MARLSMPIGMFVACLTAACALARGDGINPPKPSIIQPLPADGKVTVNQSNDAQGRPRFVSDTLSLTNKMAPISLDATTQAMFKFDFSKGSSHTFDVPSTIKDSSGTTQDVTDYHENIATFAYAPPPADTSLVAYAFNPSTNQYSGLPIFGTIAAIYGYNNPLNYPYLANTSGTTLYEEVVGNLLGSLPPLSLDATYTFTDGTSAALPGILLSTTPFGFDSTNGPTGTGFTGNVAVVGISSVAAVPEPSGLALLAAGLAGASLSARRAFARRNRDGVAPVARPPVRDGRG